MSLSMALGRVVLPGVALALVALVGYQWARTGRAELPAGRGQLGELLQRLARGGGELACDRVQGGGELVDRRGGVRGRGGGGARPGGRGARARAVLGRAPAGRKPERRGHNRQAPRHYRMTRKTPRMNGWMRQKK